MDAAPFLKWAGGKTKLLDDILPQLPAQMACYYEPFLGGGAVFFALARARRFRRAVLSDVNPELVHLYRTVRDDVEGLIEALEPLSRRVDAESFYELRAMEPEQMAPQARAARFIFLNKTCFNGLYRVNRRGRFNVPFGRYVRPKVLDAKRLRACAEALVGVEVHERDFEISLRLARPGDAIYLDPPYVPVSSTASFTSYAKGPFGPTEQERLCSAFIAALHRGARGILSNSDTPNTRALYAGLEVRTVQVARAINRDPARRGPVGELLVCGLPPKSASSASGRSARRRAVAG
ncbi:MAG: DNA adenine methylase [Myxococcota bacterium]